jgi:DNA-binding NarL/FixJ family response regulator
MKKLHVFLVDDHAVFRQGLTMLINAQPDMEVVGEACDGQEVVQQASPLQPDVVVMDVSMPTVDGAQATEHLKHVCPTTKVLALTAYEEGKRVRQLLQAGASGYLLKRVAADELTHAIRTVAEGGMYLDPTIAGKVVEGYLQKSILPDEDTESRGLSGREADVMRLLAWGYSNKEIAAHLGLSVKTVETYKARLMEKLRLQSRVDIVRYAVRHGWLQEP